jgi:hypothetical protein
MYHFNHKKKKISKSYGQQPLMRYWLVFLSVDAFEEMKTLLKMTILSELAKT